MNSALFPAILLATGLTASSAAFAQTHPACGIEDYAWSLEDGAEEFFILAAQEAEYLAASWYQTAAQRDVENAIRLHSLAAMASERAIADLAAAARILEEKGQLRYARSTRALKDNHRERAEANWEQVDSLGGTPQPGIGQRRFACEAAPEGNATEWRARARGYFDAAERVAERSELPYTPAQIRGWAKQVVLGADALVSAGCLVGAKGLEDLLDAGRCYLAVASDLGTEVRSGNLCARGAAVLRTIALLRKEGEEASPRQP